jgi:hypothetical protein
MALKWVSRSVIAILAMVAARGAPAETLDIYFIDVEGGQSTLLVTPNGDSLLIDTGFPGDGKAGSKPGEPSQSRDANRIVAAARDAGINNGLKKGGSLATYEALHHVLGLEDVWQLHRSDAAGGANFAAERIANLDEGTAHWIKLSGAKDGSFRVLNGRTGEWKNYPARDMQ